MWVALSCHQGQKRHHENTKLETKILKLNPAVSKDSKIKNNRKLNQLLYIGGFMSEVRRWVSKKQSV